MELYFQFYNSVLRNYINSKLIKLHIYIQLTTSASIFLNKNEYLSVKNFCALSALVYCRIYSAFPSKTFSPHSHRHYYHFSNKQTNKKPFLFLAKSLGPLRFLRRFIHVLQNQRGMNSSLFASLVV